jgi:hypothetical protein
MLSVAMLRVIFVIVMLSDVALLGLVLALVLLTLY